MLNLNKRYVITGMGVCNTLGIGVDNTYAQILSTQKQTPKITKWDTVADPAILINRAFELPDVDSLQHDGYNSREARSWPLLTKAAAIAVHEAATQANIFHIRNVATLISSIGGGNDARWVVEKSYHSGKTKANPFQTLGISYDYTAGAIAQKYQWNGPSTVMVSACASGLYTIDYAIKCLAAGDCDVAVVGGTDAMADQYNLYFFQVLHALTKRDEDFISQPFSNERDGFVMGEGCGVIVLETMEHAINRGATILAEVCGQGFYTETDHPTAPSDSGTGALAAAQTAIKRSGIAPEDIGFINAHATSTPVGDAIEYNAMNSLLPDSLITSAKGHIGHTMSACGIIETIYGIKSLHSKQLFPVANFTQCGFEDQLKINKQLSTINTKYFLKNSYGFGGKCASAVIGLV
jgi:3-oxoacyl-[acyl-carrier-protein] synthase II